MAPQPRERKKWLPLIVAGVVLSVLLGWLTWLCMPFFRQLSDPDFQRLLQDWIDSLGAWGWLFLLAIQILQIVIAFIPGEPVELFAGVLYGAWGGLAVCLLGIVLGEALVFFIVRRFGKRLVERLFGPGRLEEYRFLNTTEKLETVTFLLFLIPGTPKDTLTYLAGITPIRARNFLLLSTFARIPSVISSTWMGATVSRGEWLLTVIVFLLTAGIGLAGILYKERMMARFRQRTRMKNRSNEK